MRRFRAGAVEAVMDRFNIPEDVPIESKMVTRQIKSAQTQIEGQNAEIRKNVLKYDEVLNKQRQVIYAERKRVLDGEDLHEQVRHMIDDVVGAYVTGATADGYAEDWDLEQLWSALKQLYPVGVTIEDVEDEAGGERNSIDPEFLLDAAQGRRPRRVRPARGGARRRGDPRAGAAGAAAGRSTASGASTSTRWTTCRRASACGPTRSATRWSSTSARASTCSPPMMDGIKEETVGFLFNLEVQVEESPAPAAAPVAGGPAPVPLRDDATVEIRAKGLGRSRQPQGLQYTAPTIDGGAGAGSVEIQQAPALGVGGAGAGAGGGAPAAAQPSPSGRRPSPRPVGASASAQRAVAQRALPVRLGQEVQALPRRSRRPRRRLTVSSYRRPVRSSRASRPSFVHRGPCPRCA